MRNALNTWRDAASWGLIAELVRRQPVGESFLVYECPYAGGMPGPVWYLNSKATAKHPQGEPQLQINNGGHIDIPMHGSVGHECQINGGLPSKNDTRIEALDYLMNPVPKQVVFEVESCYRNGETLPEQAPATRQKTIGARAIAACLALFLHTNAPLRVSGYLYDGEEPRTDLLEQFPTVNGLGDLGANLGQLFFIREETKPATIGPDNEPGVPILAIDLITGTAFNKFEQINLMNYYQSNDRDIYSLAFKLVTVARSQTPS